MGNREYVVEKWHYPNVPVYVVCPRDGKGCSWTLHRNYLLPINSNIGQDEKDAPMAGVEKTTLQLQHHLWTVSLLMQDCLGWLHQEQQVTDPRAVWINLLHLDVAHKKPRNDFHGGTRIWVCWQLPVCLASGMHWLDCVSVSMLYLACTLFSGEVQCEYTLLIPSHVCQALLSFGIEGNSFNVIFMMDLWMVGSGPKIIWPECSCPLWDKF